MTLRSNIPPLSSGSKANKERNQRKKEAGLNFSLSPAPVGFFVTLFSQPESGGDKLLMNARFSSKNPDDRALYIFLITICSSFPS
jgi:hypothetical protein